MGKGWERGKGRAEGREGGEEERGRGGVEGKEGEGGERERIGVSPRMKILAMALIQKRVVYRLGRARRLIA